MSTITSYLKRIGYGGGSSPSLETLSALHEAHVGSIPFENLDVLWGTTPDLSPDALMQKLVLSRRGGYCYEQNLLFHDVLSALGFTVTLLTARVCLGDDTVNRVRPRCHALLRVDLPEGPYIADVGFGDAGLLYPLSLRDGAEAILPLVTYRLVEEVNEVFALEANFGQGWSRLYIFSMDRQFRVDYGVLNYYSATHPHSPFTQALFCARARRTWRVVLRGRMLTVLRPEGVETREVEDRKDVAWTLGQYFDLDIPAAMLPHRLSR